MHFLLAAADAAGPWALPFCEGSPHWFCRTHDDLQGLNPSHLVFMMIPFWITVFVVAKFAVKPILHVIEEREKRTIGARAEAEDFEKRFNERMTAYDTRLADARQKASDERARTRALAAAQVEKILSGARGDASKTVDDVRSAVATERTKAREDLKKQAETLATDLAGKALGRELGSGGTGAPAGGGARTGART